jgi:phosphoglycerate dehydrogenase-like enzyme
VVRIGRILVVDPLLTSEGFAIDPGWAGPEHEVVIPDRYEADRLAALLLDADAVLTAHAPVTDDMIALASRLRLVAKPGAGVDNIDVAAARRRGVTVTNVPGARDRAVAEHALFLILFLARRAWLRGDPAWRDTLAVQLGGRTLGIVGLGRIGSHLARFGHGLGMRVLAHTRTPDPDRVSGTPVRFVELDELLRASDVVVLCVPLTEETRGLIDDAAFDLMKPTAYLVNTARGSLIDESALLAALRAGRIAGAALDVFEDEPPDAAALAEAVAAAAGVPPARAPSSTTTASDQRTSYADASA